MGNNIELNIRNLIPLVIFMYALGQFLFVGKLSGGNNKLVYIIMWIILGYMMSPIRAIFIYFTSKNIIFDESKDTYDNSCESFKPDYVELNPVEFYADESSHLHTSDSNDDLQYNSRKRSKTVVKKKQINIDKLFAKSVNQHLEDRTKSKLKDSQLKRAESKLNINQLVKQRTNVLKLLFEKEMKTNIVRNKTYDESSKMDQTFHSNLRDKLEDQDFRITVKRLEESKIEDEEESIHQINEPQSEPPTRKSSLSITLNPSKISNK